jgi:acyl carrier protein
MTISKEDTFQKVSDIISKILNIPKENITSEVTFKDIGADSLDIVEMIMGFEDTFGIEIKDEEAEKIKTVGEAILLIHEARIR